MSQLSQGSSRYSAALLALNKFILVLTVESKKALDLKRNFYMNQAAFSIDKNKE